MSTRTAILIILITLLAAFAANTYVAGLIAENSEELAAAETRRYDSYRLADELRQSSDDLTRMARTYVVTGDPRYQELFNEILAIREGRAPRPRDYGDVYWDLVMVPGEKPRPDGEPVALETLMREAHFTGDELELLEEAKARSDALVALEERAMNALNGLFPDQDGTFVVRGDPDPDQARQLMHGDEYHAAKAAIMQPIDEFFGMVDARTAAEVEHLRGRGQNLLWLAVLVMAGSAFAVLAVFLVTFPRPSEAIAVPDTQAGSTGDSAPSSQGGTTWLLASGPMAITAVVVIALVVILTWWTQSQIEARAREDISNALTTVLNATSKAVDHWIREREAGIESWAEHVEIQELVADLLEITPTPETLLRAPAQNLLREQLESLRQRGSIEGFFIASPDRTIIASSRDADLGRDAVELILGDLLERVATGPIHTALSLPQRPTEVNPATERGVTEMMVATTVRDADNTDLGTLVFRYDAEKDFTEILQRGRMGTSGESYAFNREGQLVSESRFNDDLRQMGLIAEEERSILNIDIRDPGGNLQEGYVSPVPSEQQPLTFMARNAIEGGPGANLDGYNDYRGVPVIGAWTWNEESGLGITTEIDVSEAYDSVYRMRRSAATGATFTVVLIVALTAVFLRSRRSMAVIHDQLEARAKDLRSANEELENINSVILRWDKDGKVLFLNDFGQQLFGFTEDEVIGHPLLGTIVPDNEPAVRGIRHMLDNILKDAAKYGVTEDENCRKDGRRVWMAWRNKPILNKDGGLKEILTVGIDITERKQAEQKFRSVTETANDAIISADHMGQIISWNNAATRILGYTEEEVVGQRLELIIPARFHEAHSTGLERFTTTGAGRMVGKTAEVAAIHKDGSEFPVELSLASWSLEDKRYYTGMIRDISERKRMESEVERARKAAEAANRAKSTFLANMSHELRTPMNAIIGYSEMLAEDAEDEGHEEMIPDLGRINTAGKHLLSLINDILDLSKIEAGRMDLYLETFDLGQMLRDAVTTVGSLFSTNRNELVTEFGDDLGTVRADLTKVRQALFNLLSNAAKFTEDGTITLAARREHGADGDRILMSVADTGIGIAEDKIDRVFEEFSQADDSTTRDYGGTGLGLAISRRFCRMMGGDITLASERGKGSVFTIELPAKVSAQDAAAAADSSVATEQPSSPVSPHPVLVIDDDPDARELLTRALEADGYSITVASNGKEGLEIARRLQPSLITLDVMMPEMDGWEVLKRLKADPALRNIPVVMISIAGEKDLGYALGAVDYLTKPVDRGALLLLAHQYADPQEGGRVLIVEDDEPTRSLMRAALEQSGWEVTEAENGAVGLEVLSETTPDLILLDLMMPVMDGFEFVLEMRERKELRSIPIVVVTAKDLTAEDHARLEGAVVRILEKSTTSRNELADQVLSNVAHFVERDRTRKEEL